MKERAHPNSPGAIKESPERVRALLKIQLKLAIESRSGIVLGHNLFGILR